MNTLMICTLLLLVSGISPDLARQQMTRGVDSIPVLGTPGTMSVWGDEAFPVVFGNNKAEPIAAAAVYGNGRFFAIAHGAYVGGLQNGDPSRFMKQVSQWVGNKANPQIETLSNDTSNWNQTDILMWGQNTQLTAEHEAALLAWVHDGGGVIASACPWGWKQVTGKDLTSDLSQNRVMATFGMQYGGNYASGTNGVFVIEGIHEETHALVALQSLKDTGVCTDIGSNAILYAIHTAPEKHHSFLESVRSIVANDEFKPPTAKQPLSATDVRDRLYVALYTHEWKSGGDVGVARGSDVFPGTVDPSVSRIEETLNLEPIERGWQSTGLYLNAGETLSLHITKGNPKGWTLQVGCHKDTLWHLGNWKRWPEITYSEPLSTEMQVATPWGGLLYFIPSEKAQDVSVSINGVVEAPLFDSNDPNCDWEIERMHLGIWAELKGDQMVITVPSASICELEDPKAVTDFWDEVWSSHCELAGVATSTKRERFVADRQISAGYMHSGYPIMTWLDVATPSKGKIARVVDVQDLIKRGSWGHFHELGHNRQRGWWTFAGTGEVTCNLFSLHAGEVMCGIEPWENGWLQGQLKGGRMYLEDGADFAKWKRSPGIALISYAQIQKEFGWEPFTTVFKDYEALPAKKRPKNNQEKMDEWVRRISQATKHDLRPFYQSWGMPLSDALLSDVTLHELEAWTPEPF